jgi:hypothetical protein
MTERAAHLLDAVLPRVPVRQWVQRWVGLAVIANNLKVLGRAGPRAA